MTKICRLAIDRHRSHSQGVFEIKPDGAGLGRRIGPHAQLTLDLPGLGSDVELQFVVPDIETCLIGQEWPTGDVPRCLVARLGKAGDGECGGGCGQEEGEE